VAGTWGEGILDQVATDLRAEFPSMKGFSRLNLKYMRAFAQAWPNPEFGQQPVGQIPWGHNLVLLTKLKDKNPDAKALDIEAMLAAGRYGRGPPGGAICDPRLEWDGRADDGHLLPGGVYLAKLKAPGVLLFKRIVFRGK